MRLIDADELKKAFKDTVCIEPMPYAFINQIIDNAPTVNKCNNCDLMLKDYNQYMTGHKDGYN